ncbi:MAG: hypothetical protein JWO45_2159 [Spartobacteria bacterium]|nr:hypothetical protein [Spartobacteria bacterium]
MLERIVTWCAVMAIGSTFLSGCAYATKSGRQRMAYERYVKKYSGRRAHRVAKFKAAKMPRTPEPSQYKISSEAGESPQSVTSGASQTGE